MQKLRIVIEDYRLEEVIWHASHVSDSTVIGVKVYVSTVSAIVREVEELLNNSLEF